MTPRRRLMIGSVVMGWIVVCLSASLLLAKPGVVKTKDGRSIEGDIEERDDAVVVTVRGIPTSIPRESVDSIAYTGSIQDQYKERLAKLPNPPAAADHLDLAKWLLSNKAYDLAMTEVAAAQRIDPNSSDAATLQQTIEGQMRLDRTPKPNASNSSTRSTTARPPSPGGVTPTGYTASMHKYVTSEDINTMRQLEWPADDTTVRVAFNNDVRRKFATRMQQNVVDFNALSPAEAAIQIISNGLPEERKDVRVLTDPAPLTEYKRVIQPMILSNCATAACHGGPAGGRFFLYNTPANENANYTNFYTISQTSAKTPEGDHLLVDRTYPDRSLLAMWGLPAEISKASHPAVPATTWRPLFRSADDSQYVTLTNWMKKLVPVNSSGSGLPVPQYGFPSPFPPLGSDEPKPATKPATRPANPRTPKGK